MTAKKKEKPEASNFWFLSRIAGLIGSGVVAKSLPYVAGGVALLIAVDGCYRWCCLRKCQEDAEQAKREAIKRAVAEKEKENAIR